jgi:hypothetical protein
MGLGNEETTLPLGIPMGNLGRASFLTRFEASVDVPVRRLTDYASEIGLSRIDFIKLDVEGFETEVLRGGLDLIRETRPRAILLEEHAPLDPLPPSLQLLKGLGYRLFLLPRTFLTVKLIPFDEPGHRKSHDYVAVQPEVRLPA